MDSDYHMSQSDMFNFYSGLNFFNNYFDSTSNNNNINTNQCYNVNNNNNTNINYTSFSNSINNNCYNYTRFDDTFFSNYNLNPIHTQQQQQQIENERQQQQQQQQSFLFKDDNDIQHSRLATPPQLNEQPKINVNPSQSSFINNPRFNENNQYLSSPASSSSSSYSSSSSSYSSSSARLSPSSTSCASTLNRVIDDFDSIYLYKLDENEVNYNNSNSIPTPQTTINDNQCDNDDPIFELDSFESLNIPNEGSSFPTDIVQNTYYNCHYTTNDEFKAINNHFNKDENDEDDDIDDIMFTIMNNDNSNNNMSSTETSSSSCKLTNSSRPSSTQSSTLPVSIAINNNTTAINNYDTPLSISSSSTVTTSNTITTTTATVTPTISPSIESVPLSSKSELKKMLEAVLSIKSEPKVHENETKSDNNEQFDLNENNFYDIKDNDELNASLSDIESTNILASLDIKMESNTCTIKNNNDNNIKVKNEFNFSNIKTCADESCCYDNNDEDSKASVKTMHSCSNSKSKRNDTNTSDHNGLTRPRNFVCTFKDCKKSYLKSSHLKQHLRSHTGK